MCDSECFSKNSCFQTLKLGNKSLISILSISQHLIADIQLWYAQKARKIHKDYRFLPKQPDQKLLNLPKSYGLFL